MIYKYFLCALFIADISETYIFSIFSRLKEESAIDHMSSDQIGRVLDVGHANACVNRQMLYRKGIGKVHPRTEKKGPEGGSICIILLFLQHRH